MRAYKTSLLKCFFYKLPNIDTLQFCPREGRGVMQDQLQEECPASCLVAYA